MSNGILRSNSYLLSHLAKAVYRGLRKGGLRGKPVGTIGSPLGFPLMYEGNKFITKLPKDTKLQLKQKQKRVCREISLLIPRYKTSTIGSLLRLFFLVYGVGKKIMAFKKNKKNSTKQNNTTNSNTTNTKPKKKKKPQSKASKWIWRLIFIIGIVVMAYPFISRLYYRIDSTEDVDQFKAGTEDLSTDEIKRRIDLAHAFNESLSGEIADDPYTREKQEAGRKEYARMLELNEMMGHVEIPRINQDLPMYAGTSEDVLQKGIGHLEGTSLPVGGNNTHSVLTAHSGLPEATLFTHLNQLEIGDKFYIHNIEGVMAYQVDQVKVIEPTNFEDLVVFPGHDYVTLLTCTPIMINTHRLIVRGHRVPYVPAVDEELIRTNRANWIFRILFFVALFLILVLIIRLIRLRKQNKDYYQRLEEVRKEQDELKKIVMGGGAYRPNQGADMFEQMRNTNPDPTDSPPDGDINE